MSLIYVKLVKKVSYCLEVPGNYDFYLTAAAYNFSWFFDGKFLRVPLEVDGEFVVVRCYLDKSKTTVEIYARGSLQQINKDRIIDKLVYTLGINEDLSEFYQLCRDDPLLKDVIVGLHMRSVDPWYATVIAVSQQNASFRQGWSMIYRLYTNYGTKILLENDKMIIALPDPKSIIMKGEGILRECGYGYRASIIVNIAKRFAEYCDTNLYEILKNIKGVGPYTYGLAIMLAYRDYSNSIIDRWVRGLYNFVGIKNIDNYFNNYWKSYKGLATWFLTVMLDAEPLSRAIERVRKGMLKPSMKGITPLTMWKYF